MRESIDPSIGWTGEGRNVCWSLKIKGSVHRGLQAGHARAEPGKKGSCLYLSLVLPVSLWNPEADSK